MENNHIYALLVSVGDYEDINYKNLPTYKMDASLMGVAITSGLKVPADNIRILAGGNNNGYVSMRDLTRAISEFKSLSKEDIFIFYFSGHGCAEQIVMSDGVIDFNSVIQYCKKMNCKTVINIFDCCYSGGAKIGESTSFSVENQISEYVGAGVEIMSSTAKDDISRLGPNGTHSLFTGALSSAIMLPGNIKKGKISLKDIGDYTRKLIETWNASNLQESQRPVIRNNMSGTVYFDVVEYTQYETKKISWVQEEYTVYAVEPLSSLEEKRLSVFIVVNSKCSLESISKYTQAIAKKLRYADVYSTESSERRFIGKKAVAIWCYFGYDQEDIVNHIYFAHSIWAEKSVQAKYYKDNRNTKIIDGICVCVNSSYSMLKKLSEPTVSREEFIRLNKSLMFEEMEIMRNLQNDLQEILNGSLDKISFIDECPIGNLMEVVPQENRFKVGKILYTEESWNSFKNAEEDELAQKKSNEEIKPGNASDKKWRQPSLHIPIQYGEFSYLQPNGWSSRPASAPYEGTYYYPYEKAETGMVWISRIPNSTKTTGEYFPYHALINGMCQGDMDNIISEEDAKVAGIRGRKANYKVQSNDTLQEMIVYILPRPEYIYLLTFGERDYISDNMRSFVEEFTQKMKRV